MFVVFFWYDAAKKVGPFPSEDSQMGNPNDIWMCTFHSERVSRTEIDTSLVFDPRSNTFQVRVSQDYETQAKIECSYSEAEAYLAGHPEHRRKAWEAINDHMAKNSEHEKTMKAALARMKNL
jgi:hypothetical protein